MHRNHELSAPLRKSLRAARATLGWALHPVRRRQAKRRVKALLPIQRVAILCTGNICRSPYAEACLSKGWKDAGEDKLEVLSAGLMGTGRESPEEAVTVARERGLEIGSHRSTLFSLALASWADLVLVMSPAHRADVAHDFAVSKNRILILADLDPETPHRRTIFDPLGHPREAFQNSYDQIDRSLDQLIEVMRG